MKNKELSEMTRDELYEMAKEKDIPGKSNMTKEELMMALNKQGGSGSHGKQSHGKEEKHGSSKSEHGGRHK